jgi:hypothetical protein
MIRFRTDEPDWSDIPGIPKYNWDFSAYGSPKEHIPLDAPRPLGVVVVD